MHALRRSSLALAAALGLTTICLNRLSVRFHSPYPPITETLTSSEASLQDAGGTALGFRRLAADLAWIQTLQYYGTPEAGQTEFEFENGIGRYPRFLDLCKHVAVIDPYFTYVYYYGGGVLGWNLNRLGEAEDLIKQGIAHNPHEWRLTQYLAALAYQKNHDVKNLTIFLEGIAQDPECPLMMKALLANLYTKQHLYVKALHMWEMIYASGDPAYMHRALGEIKDLLPLLKTPRS